MVRTKIVCTLGPASSGAAVLRRMMRAGMDVVRLNFSHGTHAEHLARIRIVRSLNAACRRHLRVLGDLQGHRIRIGSLPGGTPLTLTKRQTVWLVHRERSAVAGVIPFDYAGPLRDIGIGRQIFIDDGNIALEVTGYARGRLKTRVVVGGLLKEHKGVNIPDAPLRFGGLSEKDRQDILFCEAHGTEYIAQSFVRTRHDVRAVRAVLPQRSPCRIIAKIENREGVRNIDEIIAASDGIMIARGDMGISLPVYEVPVIQKEIIRKCNRAKKPVITATQMLESMTERRIPTRAEVSDVANAIIDGTTMVMLSAESAVGAYPVETVAMMNNVIKCTEAYMRRRAIPKR